MTSEVTIESISMPPRLMNITSGRLLFLST